ncbi:hypothetical protein WA158_006932 [Blastocystis sp. Blastoise]
MTCFIGVLTQVIIRLQHNTRLIQDHPFLIPWENDKYNPQGTPWADDEVIGCTCSMLDCDLCHRWFHCVCVGLDLSLYTYSSIRDTPWHCENCKMALQMENQRVEWNQSDNQQGDIPPSHDQKQLLLNHVTFLLLSSSKNSQQPQSSNSLDNSTLPYLNMNNLHGNEENNDISLYQFNTFYHA